MEVGIGTKNYKTSEEFDTKLKKAAEDGVVNKDELKELEKGASKDEKAIISEIKKYGFYDLKEHLGIEFMIRKNDNIGGDFLKKLNEVGEDGIIDKQDIASLKEVGSDEEDKFVDKITKFDTYKKNPDRENSVGLVTLNSNGKVEYLDVEMYYSESDIVPGETNEEIVSNIGQNDRIDDTKSDLARCVAGSIVNATILTGGRDAFINLAQKLGLTDVDDITYENVHKVQHELYKEAGGEMNRTVAQGGGLKISVNSKGEIEGTAIKAIEKAGYKFEGLKGKEAVDNFFEKNPNGTLLVSVKRSENGTKFEKAGAANNHMVAVTYDSDSKKYYVSDTFERNGTGKNRRELSDKEVEDIFKASKRDEAKIIGITPPDDFISND